MNTAIPSTHWADAKYALQVLRASSSIVIRHLLFGSERGKWWTYLKQRYGNYGKQELRHPCSVLLMVNSGEILGTTIFCKTLREKFPKHNLIIAVDNFDAYAMAQRLHLGDLLVYTPWDFAWLAKRMQRRFGIVLAVFLMKVFHPALVQEWKRQGVCVGMISGTFTEDTTRHPSLIPLWQRLVAYQTYQTFDFLSMQSIEQRKLLLRHVARSDVESLGNIREDVSHAQVTPAEKRALERRTHLTGQDTVIIAAATRDDEGIILDAYQLIIKKIPTAKLILIPRYAERATMIAARARAQGFSVAMLSKLRETPQQVVIGDQLVELGKLYSLAKVIIFARTFNAIGGWANILEPAVHGIPIVFGNALKLRPAGLQELIAQHPEIEVADSATLATSVLHFLTDRTATKTVGAAFRKLTAGGERIARENAEFVSARYIARSK